MFPINAALPKYSNGMPKNKNGMRDMNGICCLSVLDEFIGIFVETNYPQLTPGIRGRRALP
jgi:hypothetical protein